MNYGEIQKIEQEFPRNDSWEGKVHVRELAYKGIFWVYGKHKCVESETRLPDTIKLTGRRMDILVNDGVHKKDLVKTEITEIDVTVWTFVKELKSSLNRKFEFYKILSRSELIDILKNITQETVK